MAIVVSCGFLAVLFGVLFILRLSTHTRISVGEHVASVMYGNTSTNAIEQTPRRQRRSLLVASWLGHLEIILRHAEIDLGASEFVMRWALIAASGMLAFFLAWGFLGSIFVLAVFFLATLVYLHMRGQLRVRRFDAGLNDMLTILTNSLRAGHSFAQALNVVCQDMQGPVQEEFTRLMAEMQVGVGLEEALERANGRIGSEDFDLVTTAITIQRQVGGNLAEVLEKISETIRERVRLKREVKTLTSQGRLSALIFMVMPVGVGVILYVMNPSYIGVLFQSPLGLGMLLVAAVGQTIGYYFIRRIVNIDM